MSTSDLLARLARLDAEDRAWLLGELSPAMRRELAGMLATEEAPAVPAPAASAPAPVAAPGGWESIDPERAAAVLESEPAWLTSAATRGAETQWRTRLLQTLTARRRHDVELADRGGRVLGTRAARLVLEGCRERAAHASTTNGAAAPRARFATLLAEMRRRFA